MSVLQIPVYQFKPFIVQGCGDLDIVDQGHVFFRYIYPEFGGKIFRNRTVSFIIKEDIFVASAFAVFRPEFCYKEVTVSYTHLRAHETGRNLVCRLLLEKK